MVMICITYYMAGLYYAQGTDERVAELVPRCAAWFVGLNGEVLAYRKRDPNIFYPVEG